jgi:putative tryptophan/tyrosine transport system substrate-binding protein
MTSHLSCARLTRASTSLLADKQAVDGRNKSGHDAEKSLRLAKPLGRREFIALMGGAASSLSLLWPVSVRAQQPAMPVIGFLSDSTPDKLASRLRAFREGLSETGYVEGRNIAIEYRWANDRYDRLPALAADLVRRQVAVLVTLTTPTVLAAKAATTTIPILFVTGIDPVAFGLVASLNRPGGNLTGVANLNVLLMQKKLELLHELVPAATTVALLVNPANSNVDTVSSEVAAAARVLGLQLELVYASTQADFDTVFATLVQRRTRALVIGDDPFFGNHDELLATLTIRHAVPAIFSSRDFVAAGGLMAYGGGNTEPDRIIGRYAGRILRGEKPADLPVQQTTKIELTINLRTAKALGLTVPLPLLAFADEVIE